MYTLFQKSSHQVSHISGQVTFTGSQYLCDIWVVNQTNPFLYLITTVS